MQPGYQLQRMWLFRRKRGALDRVAASLIRAATCSGPVERPLVIGLGSAGFSPNSRGQLSAPTTALHTALIRAIKLERGRGRRHVELHDIWEHRTLLCCCACGAVT